MTQPATNKAPEWKPLIVCPAPEFHPHLLDALAHVVATQPAIASEYPPPGVLPSLLARNGFNICFVDAATDTARAESIIDELAALVPVVALHTRNDADLILRCLRRGASEFLSDANTEAVRRALERLARTRANAAPRAAGVVYCVAPGKAGCGASTVAAHVAIHMKEETGGPVLLIDADYLAGSIAFLLKLKPEFHLDDALRDWSRMDDDLWSRLALRAYGVDILAAPENPSSRPPIGSDCAVRLVSFWRERYRTIVVDLPDIYTCFDNGLAALADSLLLVTTNELAALHVVGRGLHFLDSSGVGRSKLRLILNRYNPATGLKTGDLKTALGMEPFATLSNDYETLQSALLEGRPAPASSRFHTSVQKLCRQLSGVNSIETQQQPSWLKRIMGRNMKWDQSLLRTT